MSAPRRKALFLLTTCLAGCPDSPVESSESTSTGDASTTTSTSAPTTTIPEPPTSTTTTSGESSSSASSTGDSSTTSSVDVCQTFLCGDPLACCAADDACLPQGCAPGCASGVRCGDDPATCCDVGDVCIAGTCTPAGADCAGDADCEIGFVCDPGAQQCVPYNDMPACIVLTDSFELGLEWSATDDEVIAMPVVVDLHADGHAEVVVNTTRQTGNASDYGVGELVALDGATGDELWRITHDPVNQQFGAHGRATIAAGDVSGDGQPDIVYAGRPVDPGKLSTIHAVDGDGVLLWTARNPDNTSVKITVESGAAVLVNLDDDPQAEVAFGAAILDHDGLLVWNQNGAGGLVGTPHDKGKPTTYLYRGGLATFADLTGDQYPELVTGREAWTIDWTAGNPPVVTLTEMWKATSGFAGDGYPAVADLDGDGDPEVVLVAWPEIKVLDGATGELWCGVDPTGVLCDGDDSLRTQPINLGAALGAPATIADFDGDGRPEFAITLGTNFRVFDLNRDGEQIVVPDGDPMPKSGAIYTRWSQPVQDASSSSTPAGAFDPDGDGDTDVFYQDECAFRIFDGKSGEVLVEIPSSSATIHEFPVLADIDADAAPEVLLVANLSDPQPAAACAAADPQWTARKGVYAYGAVNGAWAPTRDEWTMHAYHVTNVASDGNVPLIEQDNWTSPGLNNFRAALQGTTPPNTAPDLSASLAVGLEACTDSLVLRATIFNYGALGVPAGLDVTFHASGDELTTVQTSSPLVPGGSTLVETTVPAPAKPTDYFVVVDSSGAVDECDENNNSAPASGAACP